MIKQCSKCKQFKTLDNFHHRTDYPGFYSSHCKACKCYKQLFLDAKRRAKDRSLEFDLTIEWVLEHLKPLICEATGMQLTLEVSGNRRTHNRPSIDRIDNNKGYTQDNSRIVANIYNMAKSDWLDKDVLEMALALVNKETSN